jgi:hypothetical protein
VLLEMNYKPFTTDPMLLDSPYRVKSLIPLEVFQLVLDVIKGTSVTMTHQKISEGTVAIVQ